MNEWGFVSEVVWPTEGRGSQLMCSPPVMSGRQGGSEGKTSWRRSQKSRGGWGGGGKIWVHAASMGTQPNLVWLCFSCWWKQWWPRERKTTQCEFFSGRKVSPWKRRACWCKWTSKLDREQTPRVKNDQIYRGNMAEKQRKCVFTETRTLHTLDSFIFLSLFH